MREFQNIEKIVIFRKKYHFTKGIHSYVSNLGLNRNSSKKAGFKRTEVPAISIGSYAISACAV